ncbi:MAG: hypothetical protein Q8O41_06900 [Candidatus Methanoperedens sp.]|nr:hypothetical protein [Candidatus Methanoperedens sp.]
MNTVSRIAKNTLVLLIAQVVSMGLGFFYTMYTARYPVNPVILSIRDYLN